MVHCLLCSLPIYLAWKILRGLKLCRCLIMNVFPSDGFLCPTLASRLYRQSQISVITLIGKCWASNVGKYLDSKEATEPGYFMPAGSEEYLQGNPESSGFRGWNIDMNKGEFIDTEQSCKKLSLVPGKNSRHRSNALIEWPLEPWKSHDTRTAVTDYGKRDQNLRSPHTRTNGLSNIRYPPAYYVLQEN